MQQKHQYLFDFKNKQLHLLVTLSKTPVKLLYAGKKGIIACIEQDSKTDTQLIQLTSEGKITKQENLKAKFVRSVVEFDNRLFYVYVSNNFVGLRDLDGNVDRHFLISTDTYLGNIIYDKNKGFFVVNEGNSVSFFDKNLTLLKREKFDFLIHDVINDTHGNLFLATNNGIHIIRLIEQKIKTFLKNKQPNKINDNYSCRAILKIDNDKLIVNTNKRRQLINLKTGQILPLKQFEQEAGANNRFILSALKDKDGDLIFGEDALFKTDLQQHRNITLCNLDSTKIWAIAQYQDGLLLGLEKKGIIYFDKKTKQTKQYSKIDKTLKNSIIYDFYMVNENKVLVASEAGLYRMINNEVFQKISFPKQKDKQMTCFSLKKDKK